MTSTLIALALIGLLAYALERNHRRQHPGPRPPLAGSSDVLDRDAQRVYAELAFLPATETAGHAGRTQPHRSRTSTRQPTSRRAHAPEPQRHSGAAGLTRRTALRR